MSRRRPLRRAAPALVALACACTFGLSGAAPARAGGLPISVVFLGDPVNLATGLPYEILPGQPLVTAGPDGRLGTADDIIDPSRVGDIDLVVRLGAVDDTGAIPAPTVERGPALAVAVAGARGVGTTVPFHVYLSDGAAAPSHPYGNLLAALDMEGLPVIVLVFADRDGDGVIGPSGDVPASHVRQLAELEAVGREVAFFHDGVASGTVTVSVGGPTTRGGLGLVATALAFTGTYNPSFLGGFVPTGPGITTAQPFLPERDPARLFQAMDMNPAAVDYPLNPEPRAAGLPGPGFGLALALPTDGSSPTVDTVRAVAGPAVCARIVERTRGVYRGIAPEPVSLLVGTEGSARKRTLRVVAVDRLGNPTDAEPAFTARVTVDGPLAVRPDRDDDEQTEALVIKSAKGTTVKVLATGPGEGTVRVTVGGAVCQRLAFASSTDRNRGAADVVVDASGRGEVATIEAALAVATDRNGDGRVTIAVGEGIYRENVRLTAPVEVWGAGAGRTVIDGRGLGQTLVFAHSGAKAEDLTASGGTVGVALEAPANASNLEAWANIGAGITLVAPGAAATACVARQNGGDGFSVQAYSTLTGNVSRHNSTAGIAVTGAAGAALIDNLAAANGTDGITVANAGQPMLLDNASAGNLLVGIRLAQTTGSELRGNRVGANEADGLLLTQSNGATIDANDFTANDGYGMRINQSSADFDALPGVQAPPGSNDVSDNEQGGFVVN